MQNPWGAIPRYKIALDNFGPFKISIYDLVFMLFKWHLVDDKICK